MEPATNATTASNVGDIFHNETETSTALKTTAFTVILILSFCGNATLIAIIHKNANQRMRTISSLFIANMAVSNLFLVIGNVPFTITASLNKGAWFVGGTFGRVLCKFCMMVWFCSEMLSSGSLSAIAVDRFLLVFFPMKQLISKRLAAVLILLSWVVAIGFTSPVFYFTDTFTYNDALYCSMSMFLHDSIAEYMVIVFSMFIATPIIIVTSSYAAIILKLLGRKAVGENVSNERKEKQRKENCKTSILLLVSVVLFALCVMPYWIGNIYCLRTLNFGKSLCTRTYLDVSFVLTVVNAGSNPFIYLIFSKAYRDGARNLFFKVSLSHDDTSMANTITRRQGNRVEPMELNSAL